MKKTLQKYEVDAIEDVMIMAHALDKIIYFNNIEKEKRIEYAIEIVKLNRITSAGNGIKNEIKYIDREEW